jgi:DNA-directed RNA polymerase subunit RPC12/RpoP
MAGRIVTELIVTELIAAEVCPDCGSRQVRAVDPGWFRVDLDRRAELDDGFLDRLDLECRDCGLVFG